MTVPTSDNCLVAWTGVGESVRRTGHTSSRRRAEPRRKGADFRGAQVFVDHGANPALPIAVSAREFLTLRVLGLPTQMAATAVPAVLRGDRAVSVIDLVEVVTGAAKVSAVDVVVSAREAARVREKLLNSFAALYVEEVGEQADEPTCRRTRLRSRDDRPGSSEKKP